LLQQSDIFILVFRAETSPLPNPSESPPNNIMTTRFFLPVALAFTAALTLLGLPVSATADDADQPQYYEVRIYHTKSPEQQQRINNYWQNAAVPACNRQGVQPIGVFTEIHDSPTNSLYVLIPFDSLQIFGDLPAKLAADTAYQTAAADFLNSTKTNAAYERIESSLLVAFNGMKHLVNPPPDQKPNVFELRTYLSPSEAKGLNKIEMFESGEITLMKEIGLAPIFYGRKLIGPNQPCLMYMTSGVTMEEHNQHWKTFSAAPVWKKLTANPYYKDNVTGIIKVLLKRTAASQI
jgi:hypothetical protein